MTRRQGCRCAGPTITGQSGLTSATRVHLMESKSQLLPLEQGCLHAFLHQHGCSEAALRVYNLQSTGLYLWSYSGVHLPPSRSLGNSRSGKTLVCWCTHDCTDQGLHTRQHLRTSCHLPSACTQLHSDNAKEQPYVRYRSRPSTPQQYHTTIIKTSFLYLQSSPFPVGCCSSSVSNCAFHPPCRLSGSCHPHPSHLHS